MTVSQILTKSLQGNVWNVQQAIFEALKSFTEQCLPQDLNDAVLRNITDACIAHGVNNLKYSAIRSATLDVLETIVASANRKLGCQMSFMIWCDLTRVFI